MRAQPNERTFCKASPTREARVGPDERSLRVSSPHFFRRIVTVFTARTRANRWEGRGSNVGLHARRRDLWQARSNHSKSSSLLWPTRGGSTQFLRRVPYSPHQRATREGFGLSSPLCEEAHERSPQTYLPIQIARKLIIGARALSDLGKYILQCSKEDVGVLSGEWQRRPDFKDIAMFSCRAD